MAAAEAEGHAYDSDVSRTVYAGNVNSSITEDILRISSPSPVTSRT